MISKNLRSLILLAVFLAAGYYVSVEVNKFLGISYNAKDVPVPGEHAHDRAVDASRRYSFRLVDMGGVGILPDTANWGNNYEHNVHRFEDLFLENAPYVNPEAFERIERELQTYTVHMAEFGMTGIVFPGFLEYVNFSKLGDGSKVYRDEDYVSRHLALREHFCRLMTFTQEAGLKVYLYTDMVALTPSLKAYMEEHLGGIDTESEALWEIYRAAAEEVFETMPVDGLMIRIGEAGAVYNKPGWDYFSELYVRTDEAVRMMLEAFLETAEKYDKTIIFRTWSVGVGEIGDMHTNPETYTRVIEPVQSDNLVISTKYCRGDYYAWLPFNPTILEGKHRRIAEFQLRREFEGLGSLVNYMGPLYQAALQEFSSGNPGFEGVWLWTQEGGPLRAGPLAIYPFHGFNTVNDANVYAAGRLVQDPCADITEVTGDWIRDYFGIDSLLVENMTELLLMSHGITKKGLYISEFAKWDVRALGLEPPPMLWIFEWDIVGSSSAVMSTIHHICKDELEEVIREGYEAQEGVRAMVLLAREAKDLSSANREDFELLLASLDYQENLFGVLAKYREFFLVYNNWLYEGGKDNLQRWKGALVDYRELQEEHDSLYLGNLDFPAYNFREANVGANLAGRTLLSLWSARIIFVLILAALFLGSPGGKTLLPESALKSGLVVFFNSVFAPAQATKLRFNGRAFAVLAGLMLLFLCGGLFAFTSYTSVRFTGMLVFLSLTYVLATLLFYRAVLKVQKRMILLGVLAPGIMIIFLLLAFSLLRGPMHLYYLLWTSEGFRTIFFTLFVLCFLWPYHVLVAVPVNNLGVSRIRAFGILFLVQGIQFLLGAGITQLVGLERSLTLLNDELLILPGGLSRILGITTHLDIPLQLAVWVACAGAVFLVSGALLSLIGLKFSVIRSKQNSG